MTDDAQPTLTDIVGRTLLPFSVDGKQFYVRQPMPEEYDDAEALKTLWYERTLAEAYVQEVAHIPCSQGERALFQAVLDATATRFEGLPPDADPVLKEHLKNEITRLSRDVTDRTLAQEYASDKATLKRDRWLTMRLLLDENQQPVFKLGTAGFEREWTNFPLRVKDAARPLIWRALGMVREAPFSPGG